MSQHLYTHRNAFHHSSSRSSTSISPPSLPSSTDSASLQHSQQNHNVQMMHSWASPSSPQRHRSQHRDPRPSQQNVQPAQPMAIWQAQRTIVPLPPLPPPTHIPELASGQDLGWSFGNDANASDFARPVALKAGASLLGYGAVAKRDSHASTSSTAGAGIGPKVEAGEFATQRASIASTVAPGSAYNRYHPDFADVRRGPGEVERSRASSSLPSLGPTANFNLQSERQLEQWTREESSKSYDTQLLSRIGGPNQPANNSKRPSLVAGLPDSTPAHSLSHSADLTRLNSSLHPSTANSEWPYSTSQGDATAKSRPPPLGTVSPGFVGSPPFDDGHRVNHEPTVFAHDDLGADEGPMGTLRIHDHSPGSPRAGVKRRASSPPRERGREDRSSVSSASGSSDIFQRRAIGPPQMPTRSSPVSRFHHQMHSSISSTSSFGPRQGSLASSMGISSITSSATSYTSSGMSPPASASSVMQAQHQRTHSENAQTSVTCRNHGVDSSGHSRHLSFTNMESVHVCECCRKKPKKFDSEEALKQHEAEKQYSCQYCFNRFKNKNEAERHQNSLHLRRHSWSCAALASPEAAFHSSLYGNGSDSCGYCGQQFPNPPQWDIRAKHLSTVHKFRECNPAKKFFRADHFRQHLKHSHQGTSGKWTNMLENACMQDEPLPPPPGVPRSTERHSHPTVVPITGRALPVSAAPIKETPHDS